MNISEFMQQNLAGANEGEGSAILSHTQLFSALYNLIGNERATEATTATVLWQIIAASLPFTYELWNLGIADVGNLSGQNIVVSHGNDYGRTHYNLLILSPQYRKEAPTELSLDQSYRALEDGYRRWRQQQLAEFSQFRKREAVSLEAITERSQILSTSLKALSTQDLEQIAYSRPFKALVARMPVVVPSLTMNVLQSIIPSPAWGVATTAYNSAISTVGIASYHDTYGFGVTACLHGVFDQLNDLNTIMNTQGIQGVLGRIVWINGQQGIIREADYITDSCFIQLNNYSLANSYSTQGPMKYAPPVAARVEFTGIASGTKNTYVKGHDMSIFSLLPGSQPKVYTEPITSPGDSGATLIDENDYVVGFSFNRTGLGEYPEFSSWMWAHAVYNALGLGTTV
ncbi:hypothetical protein [Fischerella sp. PCC 9605]|uniref:hypothetical protein n=1 Tax=Fischerella sp. PCC 9605 TaxID=1173024 RepID=UPI0004B225EE|nr:hypothetical protein [Fischerella sp. PCC 9605]